MNFRFNDGRDWFFEKRFGLFIHFGLYAIDGWYEQMIKYVPAEEYERLIHRFNPESFDPDKWLDLAEQAGMEYICFTSRHCDGFCLWDTKTTDYNVMNTPYGKDFLRILSDACHRRNFPLCIYYTPMDWHNPYYCKHACLDNKPSPNEYDKSDFKQYMDFVRQQVIELCTGYGELHGFWWDGGDVLGIRDDTLNDIIRRLQPNAVINNRGFSRGDFDTPERDWYSYVNGEDSFQSPVEACQSIGMESWGYRKDEDYYTDRYLMQSIDKIMAKGGNYLLNVGPDADGVIPPESERILKSIGKWYTSICESFKETVSITNILDNREILLEKKDDSIIETEIVNRDILLTMRGNIVYVHLNKHPSSNRILLKPMDFLPLKATLLNTGEELGMSNDITPSMMEGKKGFLRITNIPANACENTVMIIKLEFEDTIPNY
jgi:Alpha-L-fucosidase